MNYTKGGEWKVIVEKELGDYGSLLGEYISGISSPEGTICEFRDDYGTDISANAHLIAAAPDMYEALELIRRCVNNSRAAPNVLDTIYSAAIKALVKAEGR